MNLFFNKKRKLVVLDDDPTGIQTVNGCLTLTNSGKENIRSAFEDNIHFFFILTNTRSMIAEEAVNVIERTVKNVNAVAEKMGIEVIFIFRSDSTLRGHYPLEVEKIAELCSTEYDAKFFIPAFFEGNRVTDNNIHYIKNNDTLIPCHETEFAKDSVFAYSTSFLPDYIEEKYSGRVKSDTVTGIPRSLLDGNSEDELNRKILALNSGQYAVVNCMNYSELDRFIQSLIHAMKNGRKYLFQTSASFVKSISGCIDKEYVRLKKTEAGPGLIIVGSHVAKTTMQLKKLIDDGEKIEVIEIDVLKLLKEKDEYFKIIMNNVEKSFNSLLTPVIFTSRKEIEFSSVQDRLNAGKEISEFLTRIVKDFNKKPAYVIAKGGITSNDILEKGLSVSSARVLGQATAGVPAIKMPSDNRWPGMPYVIFPGNVGDENALLAVYQRFMNE